MGQEQEPIGSQLTEKLGNEGVPCLRSMNGTLQYGMLSPPDLLGKVQKSQEHMGNIDEKTWQAVKEANGILAEMKLVLKVGKMAFQDG